MVVRSISGSQSRYRTFKISIIYVVLAVGMVIVILPFLWMVSTSLKTPADIFKIPTVWFPNPIVWENYPNAMTILPFGRFILNTAKITGLAVVGATFSGSLAAFAFARLRWRGRNFMFVLVLSTLMLPFQVIMIPQFILFRELEWLDTYLPLVVPAFFGGSAFNIFLLRQYFMTISPELDDAAIIDGCSRFGVYWRIILPLSKAALMTVVIFIVQNRWQSFLVPLIYLFDQKKYTLALGLRLFQDQYTTEWELMMAAATVSMIPVLLVFYYGQRYFIQGVVFTGVKG
ncbi:MAG: carbohydrate ABC transporter permease [Caldilineaceae bacterium]|uniref:Carbohydrate ABC transporter permease n=1 Tax=Caldilineaceae bacterium SB0664_bin_27 TaxID=2605260 RepID=A0A6B0YX89_9CHLR|nr:carbohydrate ABC transporter permease [Caldilineaceae bacterium]MDE0338872.1 carbohydrate ABC transporter permease [Caldilineaceae bacterium]MXY95704.1 carbohydrate ABC transporter permease [Caldilineaceae bacterium SB0664_bin_27]